MTPDGPAGRTGTATVVFTDLVGSTELRASLGEQAADDLRRSHDDTLGSVVSAHGGEVVKGLGDGIMATFEGTADAVAAGVAMQQAVERLNRRLEGAPLAIRVGISVGDVAWEDGDCFGEPVIEASRLCDAAGGGEVLCTDIVQILERGRGGHTFESVGEVELKGLPQPVAASRVAWAPPSVEFPLPAGLRTRSPFPFVGRIDERAVLDTAWKRSAAGQQSVVLVAGEPGVGKTRLARELGQSVSEQGGVVLVGRCDEEGGAPYQPFAEALRHFIDHCPHTEMASRLGPYAGDLHRLAPDLPERIPGLPEPLRADEDSERLRLFDAVAGWLAAAGDGATTLLVLDDLHWADKPTLLTLRHLLRGGESRRLCILGTYRDTDLDRHHPLSEMLADLRRERAVRRVDLRGLTADEVKAFIEGAAGHELEAQAEALALALHAETEGNPFFLEETLAHLIETGTIYQDDAGRWTSDVTVIEDFGIPEGVREVVGRRLSRLSDDCNRILGRAAVLGPEFDVGAVRAMADDDVVDALEEAERASLIAETEGLRPGYGFTHALVRQTLVEELSLARRQQYHVAAAEALESTGGSPAAVALHYRQAGAAADLQKAVGASLVAADEARQRLAWEDASDHWEAALELLDVRGGDPAEQAALMSVLGDAMYATGRDWERGIDQLERAVTIYDELGDDYSAAKLRSRIARNLSTFPERTDHIRAEHHLDIARPTLEERGDSPALAYFEAGYSTMCTFEMRHHEGLAAARRARAIGERLGDPAIVANARLLEGWHLGITGKMTEGRALLEAAWHDGTDLEQPIVTFLAVWMTGGLGGTAVDPLGIERLVRAELESGRQDGAPALRSLLQILLADTLSEQGRLAEAESVGAPAGVTLTSDASVAVKDGRWEEAADAAAKTHHAAEAEGATFPAAYSSYQRIRIAGLRDDRSWDASEWDNHFERVAPDDGILPRIFGRSAQSILAWQRGQLDAARTALGFLEQAVEKTDLVGGLPWLVEVPRGLMAADDAVDAHFERAVEVAREHTLPWREAETHELWGLRTGAPERVDAAIAVYEGMGAAAAWIERARRLRAEAAASG